jgi:hypothetical protein
MKEHRLPSIKLPAAQSAEDMQLDKDLEGIPTVCLAVTSLANALAHLAGTRCRWWGARQWRPWPPRASRRSSLRARRRPTFGCCRAGELLVPCLRVGAHSQQGRLICSQTCRVIVHHGHFQLMSMDVCKCLFCSQSLGASLFCPPWSMVILFLRGSEPRVGTFSTHQRPNSWPMRMRAGRADAHADQPPERQRGQVGHATG